MALEGFSDLVKLAVKNRPEKTASKKDMWDKFLYIVFMGGKRSEPEIKLIIDMLKSKSLLGLEYVTNTDGDDWRDAVMLLINERLKRIKDEDIEVMLKELQKDIFRISASIKGGARFFKSLEPGSLEELDTKEKMWEFIEGLAKNEDVTNIKYTKIIIWLHALGYAYDFVPPAWQVKSFVNNDIGPYYQFYEDDKYFMQKAGEFAEKIKKQIRGATARDVSEAVFYYITLKNMFPQRSPEKKRCTPAAILAFVKKEKLSLKNVSNKLASFEGREELAEKLHAFLAKRR